MDDYFKDFKKARDPNTNQRQLLEYTRSNDTSLVHLAAQSPNLPIWELERLVEEGYPNYVLRGVAANPNIPIELLEKLLALNERGLMTVVFNNERCPISWFKRSYLNNKNSHIPLAQSTRTPRSILVKLYKDANKEVFWYLAENRYTPRRILKDLFETGSYYRRPIAQNPNCPERLLLQQVKTEVSDICLCIARNKKLTPEIIRLLSTHKDPYIRFAISIREDCPPDILGKLITDRSINVRLAVIENPLTPIKDLIQLGKSKRRGKVQTALRERLSKEITL